MGLLWDNRNRLVEWQKDRYNRPADDKIRLHLGSGHLKYPGYINIDRYTPEADRHLDITDLSEFGDNTVDEISAHHVFEHIHQANHESVMREWFRVLKPGGQLDLGMPDLELCMNDFLGANETDRWGKFILPIYGLDNEPGMHHLGGQTLVSLTNMLTRIGFKIIESYNYDANSVASSVWVLAEKLSGSQQVAWTPTVLEQDVVMGVFTHRDEPYLPLLVNSVNKHLPHIPFISLVQDGKINENMERLRLKFIETGKRFWIFLDDDIQFLNPSIVHDAIRDTIKNGWACCSVYSDFDPACLIETYNNSGLVTRKTTWATGYFILVDSKLVGNITPDMELPDGNTSVDTSYSAEILARGYKIGISGNKVYHQKKQVWAKQDIVEITNEYLLRKWGKFYFDNIRYDGNVINWNVK